jgi:short-subunit dehydrogenase
MTQELRGRTALVTGASSGLGVDFARELAGRGADLVLVARRADALEALAKELTVQHGVKVRVMPADLGLADVRIKLAGDLASSGIAIDMLINNAGFGLFGEFIQTDWQQLDQMLQVDIVALTHLSRLFAPGMISRRWGRILQVASTGSFSPSPTYAAYSAAKAYVLSFGIALNNELEGTGVSCTTVCPGVTATDFLKVSGQKKNWYHRATMMTSASVTRSGIKAMLAGRSYIVTGWMNAVQAFSTRFMPRGLSATVTKFLMKN